uniref:Uncharacterized protein n=1 Tax=Leishmania guyanensis TaxID=5670 RepID=A0A1E1J798_LEIGU|nr:Hypothetical protein BN36_3569770 [Leishmania guyanensis]
MSTSTYSNLRVLFEARNFLFHFFFGFELRFTTVASAPRKWELPYSLSLSSFFASCFGTPVCAIQPRSYFQPFISTCPTVTNVTTAFCASQATARLISFSTLLPCLSSFTGYLL